MGKMVIAFFIIFNIWNLNDNSLTQSEEKIFFYLDVDELPQFNKGNVFEYIYNNIEYPDQIDIQGKVIVSFIINKEGKVEDVKLEKNFSLNAMSKYRKYSTLCHHGYLVKREV